VSIAEPLNARQLYAQLYAGYGPQHWWPGETPFEITVGAVLTQNTAWQNVAIAIENLRSADLLNARALADAPEGQVKEAIRPAGFYNVKYTRLRNLLAAIEREGGLETMRTWPTEALRECLLAVNGVGPETADSILLYAFCRPVFVVDSYTRRLLTRLGHIWAQDVPYATVQQWFVDTIDPDASVYNEYHALIVAHGKARCRARPRCAGCPLSGSCPNRVSATNTHKPTQLVPCGAV